MRRQLPAVEQHGDPPADLSPVLTVTVRNRQLEEARTWLWVEGRRLSLGSVRPNASQTFYFPLDGVRRLHLEFDVTRHALPDDGCELQARR